MVKDSQQITQTTIKDADIPAILSLIRIAEKEGPNWIEPGLIKKITGRTDKETFYNLWALLRSKIRYQADGNKQHIKSPGALWKSGVGDCKSFAVFIASTLQKMCIPYELILDRYDPNMPNHGHIYVRSNGVVIDPVNSVFNKNDVVWKRQVMKGIDYCSTVGSIKKPSPVPILLLILIIYLYE